jgi:ribosome-associated translation inhibitor RaiA
LFDETEKVTREILKGRENMEGLTLPIEFNIEVPTFPDEFRLEIEETIQDLSEDHQDITGASITLSQPAHGETPYLYRASIVVYMRPENVYADEKSATLEAAINGATDAIVRQVREERKKRREPWKRPDLTGEKNPLPD